MPGWYIHMDVARKAIESLGSNVGAASILGSDGPDAERLTSIAKDNPAYVALGAIGPDIFFLLPDFKPPVGTLLWGAANTIRDFFMRWDDNFLGPYERILGKVLENADDELNALTGGLANQLSSILSRAFRFLLDTVAVMISRNIDVFGALGSGVPEGFDEKTFFWSDMLHYRKTYEFAAHLWKKAKAADDERFMAFALGWMSHVATDVTGHCFVNEKCGGPYRLHWQHHHCVENHMDAAVYDSERGTEPTYQMLSAAALHFWIAFESNGTSVTSFFKPEPGPSYKPGDDEFSILRKWDADSDLPDELGQFIAEALREIYNPAFMATGNSKGACSDHPTIFNDLSPGSLGYPGKEDIVATYWWLFKYVKLTTTDYFKLARPEAPSVFVIPPFPRFPGSDALPELSSDHFWRSALEVLLAIFAWIAYLAEVAAWPEVAIISLLTGPATYELRDMLYDNLELPLYNAWAALHWYFSMTGFTYPMQQEINIGLTTLGVGVGDVWKNVEAALNDPRGGLSPVPLGTEPSGSTFGTGYPKEVVTDPPGFLASNVHSLLQLVDPPGLVGAILHLVAQDTCPAAETPSEFLRPWLYPEFDNAGDPIENELPLTFPSPYQSGQDATMLMHSAPGNDTARRAFEDSQSAQQTNEASHLHLPNRRTLGDPADYTGYLIAKLTRDNPGAIANLNLDADRGYGYLCWDWVRSGEFKATPASYGGEHAYNAPLRPGFGWCDQELIPGAEPLPPTGSPDRPTMHDPSKSEPVQIRYIDLEEKFK